MAKSKSNVLNTNNENIVTDTSAVVDVAGIVEPVKGKRGRKSKKELMAALNIDPQTMVISKKGFYQLKLLK